MNLDYSPADDAFRADIRAWLEANLPRELSDKVLNHKRLSREDFARWHKIVAKQGWVGDRVAGRIRRPGLERDAAAHLGRRVRARRHAAHPAVRRRHGGAGASWPSATRRRSAIICRASWTARTGGARAIPSRARAPTWRR